MSSDVLDVVYPSLEWSECPYPLFDHVRAERPVYKVPGRNEFVVSRFDDCVFVLRHPELFSSDVGIAGKPGDHDASMIRCDPPEHKVKRALISRPFTPSRLRDYEPGISAIVHELIDTFAARGNVEFVREFAQPLPIFVTCDLMGIPRSEYDWIRRWGRLEGVGINYLPEWRQREMREDARIMGEYLEQELLRRHREPQDDILSELVQRQVERDGRLELGYLVAEAATLLAGGVVTTAHMLASTMVLLLQTRGQLARVREDRSLITRALEESLRVESPVQSQPRIAAVDTAIGDVEIPAGSLVVVVLAAANRDDRTFSAPAEFDLDRENVKRHMGFGLGEHFCLGAPLARLEGRIAFDALLDRLRDLDLVGEGEITHIASVKFRAPTEVQLRFTPEPRAGGA